MKTLSRSAQAGSFALALVLALTASAYSQATVDECNSVYQVVLANYLSQELPKAEQALASGKEYVTKCKDLSDIENGDKIVKWVTERIPSLEKSVGIMRLEKNFNDALKQRNQDQLVLAAKKLLEINPPYSLDLILDIASVGFDNASAVPPVDKYNDDTIKYAKLALGKLAAGDKSGNKDKFGFYVSYVTDKCADGRENAAGWMNYTIGFITLTRQNNSKEALPYIYKASQEGCGTKSFSEVYRHIGSWYIDESNKLSDQRKQLIAAAQNAETPESAAMLDLQMGYIDRAIDAYARAYKVTAANPKTKAYKDGLLAKLKELFTARFDGDTSKIDSYVAKVTDTPFIDPATPVAPVKTEPVAPVKTEPSAPVKPAPVAPGKTAPVAPGKKTPVAPVKPARGTPVKAAPVVAPVKSTA
jgi:hypothetical protein